MHTSAVQVENANINLPINQAVQASDGAQFALMLSLLLESQAARPAVPTGSTQAPIQPEPQNFNLETSQSRALQNNQFHQFNLLRSLYAERVLAPTVEAETVDANIADDVLNEIEQGYQPGSAALGKEAQKISLASVPAAA